MAHSPRRSWPGWPKEGGQTLWPALSKFLNGSISTQSRLSGWLGPPVPCQSSQAERKFVSPIGNIARVNRTGHMLEATRSAVNGACNNRWQISAKFLETFLSRQFRVLETFSLGESN
ncbi:MAG: hypothetical protein DWI21_00625 [Planctomycetota bacterium]|nr:MAG: hypothetical protein DWI21_00625 [Planctomycetota bacterium]